MVGVEALAAMADRGPLSLFKSIVDNLLPMLCGERFPSFAWVVRFFSLSFCSSSSVLLFLSRLFTEERHEGFSVRRGQGGK